MKPMTAMTLASLCIATAFALTSTSVMAPDVVESQGYDAPPSPDAHGDLTDERVPAWYSAIKTDIHSNESWVMDYNLTFEDCIRIIYEDDESGDGYGWGCEIQPDLRGQPGGLIPS